MITSGNTKAMPVHFFRENLKKYFLSPQKYEAYFLRHRGSNDYFLKLK